MSCSRSVRRACEHTFVSGTPLTGSNGFPGQPACAADPRSIGRNRKGAIAEAEILAAAVRLDVPVLIPVSDHGRCDLALDIGGRLWRVQCKWGRLSEARDVVVVHLGGSRLSNHGYIVTTYDEDEVDLFGVYCGELDRAFLLPVARLAGMHQVHLRLAPPRNGQRACITLAREFEFEGAVAQLARASRWQREGQGFESPQLHPNRDADRVITVGSHGFRNRIGEWMERAAAGQDIVVTDRGKPRIRLTRAT